MLIHTTLGLLPGLIEVFRVNIILFSLKCLFEFQTTSIHFAVICWPLKSCSFISQGANISVSPNLRLFVKLKGFNTQEHVRPILWPLCQGSHPLPFLAIHTDVQIQPLIAFTYGPSTITPSLTISNFSVLLLGW